MNKKRILVLDGGNQNTLAIVRHLGRAGLRPEVVAYNRLSPACFSKYAMASHIISSPKADPVNFLKALLLLLKSTEYFLLMPVGYDTFRICMQNQEEIRKLTRVMLPPMEAFGIASNKMKTYRFAEQLGVQCPNTWNIASADDFAKSALSYPLVIKAPVEMGKNVVEYASSATEAAEKFKAMCSRYGFADPDFPVVQEFVEGEGYGCFAYYEAGVCKRVFMHKRIRENPPSGGVSTCAESFFDQALMIAAKKMLDALRWNGVAMVEFKKDKKDGNYKLMEINPKFWGSLELAIVSGVNFPWFLIQHAEGSPIEYSDKFEKVRFQWLINGELFHFFSRPASLFSILKDMSRSKKDLWGRDLLPNLVQVILVVVYYYKKLMKK